MADGLNRCTLLGHLGQDPELKVLGGGNAVLNLRLATTTSWLDKGGERKEQTDWHTVVCWGRRAEALAKILHKGSQIYVEGRLSTRKYEKNGEARYATDIQASQVILCGGKREGGEDGGQRSGGSRGGGGQRREQAPASNEQQGGAGGYDEGFGTGEGEDGIPFASPADVTTPRHVRRRNRAFRF